jgi:hypothetical protein
MRRNGAPRLHRFPQRLDYALIPAPLDLSLPLVDEKAPLPAIIVTPSSPSHDTDFSIAFLAPSPIPTFWERLSTRLPKLPSLSARLPSQIQLPSSPFKSDFQQASSTFWSLKTRVHTTFIFTILLVIMACHLIMHSVVSGHPHLEFGLSSDHDVVALNHMVSPSARFAGNQVIPDAPNDPVDDSATPPVGGWFNLHASWAPSGVHGRKRTQSFVIDDVE